MATIVLLFVMESHRCQFHRCCHPRCVGEGGSGSKDFVICNDFGGFRRFQGRLVCSLSSWMALGAVSLRDTSYLAGTFFFFSNSGREVFCFGSDPVKSSAPGILEFFLRNFQSILAIPISFR